MDNHDVLRRWAIARAEIRSLLDPPSLEGALTAATDAWLSYLTKGVVRVFTDEDLIRRSYQVSVLAKWAPLDYDPADSTWLEQLDAVATAIDIYGRLSDLEGFRQRETPEAAQLHEAARAFRRLATYLYAASEQPFKAYRSARGLLGADGGDLGDRLQSILAVASAVTGRRAITETDVELRGWLDAAESDQWKGVLAPNSSRRDDPIAELLRISLNQQEPRIHGLGLDLELIARYRRVYDLADALGRVLPPRYLLACLSDDPRIRREELLPPQRWAINHGLLDQKALAISTPTGSGKSFMAELRIAAELSRHPDGLCVYVAPSNALANQIYEQFAGRLRSAGYGVVLWTGAYELDDGTTQLGNVLVTTPEKLDYILRGRLDGDNRSADLLARCQLIVLDESHSISSGVRGLRYELLVQRIRRLMPGVSLLAMSAVQTNLTTFAKWLGGGRENHAIELPWRPTTIWDVLWRRDGSLERRSATEPSETLPRPKSIRQAAALLAANVIRQAQSVLLVETRRDYAESLARELFTEHEAALRRRLDSKERFTPGARARLTRLATQVRRLIHPQYPLAAYLEIGLAFHHSGLPVSIRRGIEDLARDEVVHTLVATTTLVEGMDLPFRCVVMVHLNFPDGHVPVNILRNIRGRAGRPFFANDGAFIIVEPDKTDTASFQYFLDTFWNRTIERSEAATAITELAEGRRSKRLETERVVQSQLLALFSEQLVELETVPRLAEDSLLAAGLGVDARPVRAYGSLLLRQAERMLQEGPLLQAASPLQLTELGRRTALSGLSGDSGAFLRATLARERDRIEILLGQRGIRWLAIRLAWVPWEAVEKSDAYEALSRQWDSGGLMRSPQTLADFEDTRLQREYSLGDALLRPMSFSEIAEAGLVPGKSSVERLTNAIDTASSMAGTLPWTLTGVIRVADYMGEDDGVLADLSEQLVPLVRQIQLWMPWPLGIDLLSGPLDRDAAIGLLAAADLKTGSREDLAVWVAEHSDEAFEIVGVEAWERLTRWLAIQ